MLKYSSRVHLVSTTAQDDVTNQQPDKQQQHHQTSHPPAATRGSTVQQDSVTAAPSGSTSLDPITDEELSVEVSGPRIHAPWPGLHGVCNGCGAPSVSGLGSSPTECEHCHRQNAGGEGGARGKLSAKGSTPVASTGWGKEGKDGVVAVTSSREVALGGQRAKALARTGAVMLATSSLLLLLLLVAW